jgi:hypothetical protein
MNKKHPLQENYERFFGQLSEAKTPWGESDYDRTIIPGVVWFGTPSHGGLRVNGKYLSPTAKELALYSGGSYWFEEDVAYAIPVYENYSTWGKKFYEVLGGGVQSKEDLEETIRRYYPQYFDETFGSSAKSKQGGINSLKVGDEVYLKGYDTYNPFKIERYYKTGYIVIAKDGKQYKLTKQRIKANLDRIEPA